MVRIAEIEAGTIAEELHLEVGTRIIRINGQRVRDGIDLTYLLSEESFEMEAVSPSGESLVLEIEREAGEPVGIVPAPDTIRECANECVFCFIDGNPPDARQSLWLRDDDFRLSFTYGSYVTLTNLGPKGMQRLVDQRISPLYVSVHATSPEVRVRLLKNDRAGLILDQLRMLTEAGLQVHTQVVLCPEWNDGAELDRTVDDLLALGDGVLTLSVVPVGLTKYNVGRPVRHLTQEEAGQALRQVDRAREKALDVRGDPWCYAADELYLIAGEPIPSAEYYDEWALVENGVGAVRRFIDDFDAGLDGLPRMDGRRIVVLTGASMAPFLGDRAGALAGATGAEVSVRTVENSMFGSSVTIAGLLPGRDLLDAATRDPAREGDVVLLPREALNGDELFIDSMPLESFIRAAAPATVISGYEVTECLRSL